MGETSRISMLPGSVESRTVRRVSTSRVSTMRRQRSRFSTCGCPCTELLSRSRFWRIRGPGGQGLLVQLGDQRPVKEEGAQAGPVHLGVLGHASSSRPGDRFYRRAWCPSGPVAHLWCPGETSSGVDTRGSRWLRSGRDRGRADHHGPAPIDGCPCCYPIGVGGRCPPSTASTFSAASTAIAVRVSTVAEPRCGRSTTLSSSRSSGCTRGSCS